jgi:hypothetical protein
MVRVPEQFATFAEAREGARGGQWARELPGLAETLFRDWGSAEDGAPLYGGVSLVLSVRRGPELRTLKLERPDETTVHGR